MTKRKIGVLLSYVLMIFEVLSTLLLTPFILRTLGQAEYGVYRLTATITTYLLLLDLGVGNAIVRYIAKYRVSKDRDNERRFLGVATIFYGAIAIISLIVGAILIYIFPVAFSKGLSPDEITLGQHLMAVIIINAAVTLGSAAYTNTIIAYEEFGVSRGASIIQIILRLVLSFVCLKAGMRSMGLVYVQLFTTILCRGFFILYVNYKIKLRPSFSKLENSFIKEIVVYSSLIFLQMIATHLNTSVGQILIGVVVASSAIYLGIYSVGVELAQYYQSIGSAFTSVLMPGLVKLVESGVSSKALCDEMIRIGRIIFMVLACIWVTFLVCGKDFVTLWASAENLQAWTVAIILMSVYMFILTESVGNQLLWAMNAHKEQSIAKLSIVVINIAFSILLIKYSPILGAAVGTFTALLLGDIVVMNVIFKKKIGISLRYYYSGLLKGIVPALAVAGLLGFLVNNLLELSWVNFIVKAFTVVFTYGVCMLLFGMNTYEKGLVLTPIKKILKKNK